MTRRLMLERHTQVCRCAVFLQVYSLCISGMAIGLAVLQLEEPNQDVVYQIVS